MRNAGKPMLQRRNMKPIRRIVAVISRRTLLSLFWFWYLFFIFNFQVAIIMEARITIPAIRNGIT